MTPKTWRRVSIGSIAEINPPARRKPLPDEKVTFLPMSGLGTGEIIAAQVAAMRTLSSGFTVFEDGDVILAKITPCFENGKGCLCNGMISGIGFGSTEFIVLRASNDVDSQFLQYQTATEEFRRFGTACMVGSAGQKRVQPAFVKTFQIALPPLREQREISKAIGFWDRSCRHAERLLKLKRRLKRGFSQQLLTGRHRFPEFAEQPWREVRIGDVLREVNRTVKLNPDAAYRLVSIRRRSGGFFDREVRLGKQIGYPALEQLHAGDFVIARRQVLHGAMGTVTPEFDGAYVSNAYAILAPHDPTTFHLPFFNFVSQLPRLYYMAYRCSYGVAIEKMFFRLDWFLREVIKVPPTLAEQQKITAVLSTADREIELLERQLAALKEQKKGLMQKLLTGQVRLPEFRTEGMTV